MSGFYTETPECRYIVAAVSGNSSIEVFNNADDARERAMDLARDTGVEHGAYRADTLFTWSEVVKL